MSYSYPLTMPTSPKPSRITWKPLDVVAASESPTSLKQQLYQHPGNLWRVEVALPPMKRAEAAEWIAFGRKLRGRWGTFLFTDPLFASPRGTPQGSPLTDGVQTIRSFTLDTKGWTPSQAGLLLPGDMISMGAAGIRWLYMILTKVDSGPGGLATIDVWPNLRAAHPTDWVVETAAPKGTFRMASNEATGWDETEGKMYGFGFSAVEAQPTS